MHVLKLCLPVALHAPMVIEGPLTERFPASMKRRLVPTLRRNDIVVTDNLRVHKVLGAIEAIEKAHNNRAYYNDWAHQLRMAQLHGTDEAKAHIGMDLFGPEPDFGALARSMGCYGEGPIDKPQDVRSALLRALAEVKKGRPAPVDTITQHR